MPSRPSALRRKIFRKRTGFGMRKPKYRAYNRRFSFAGRKVEWKNFDKQVNGIATYTNGVTSPYYLCLNTTEQGTNTNMREGRKIFVKKLNLNLCFTSQATATDGNQAQLRILVVQDTQANGTQPAIDDLLQWKDPTTNLKGSVKFDT